MRKRKKGKPGVEVRVGVEKNITCDFVHVTTSTKISFINQKPLFYTIDADDHEHDHCRSRVID